MARIHPGTSGSRFAPPAGHGGTAHEVARQRTADGGTSTTSYQQIPAGTIAQTAS
ncbi:hypothetical protein [Lentzea terrae]|uniref:hypothetical protein n=1 Tax=Lentzea terrae TaxID=2200761 RepID=UPI0013008681|nr:hypothetical protein [Lentzea terrae]